MSYEHILDSVSQPGRQVECARSSKQKPSLAYPFNVANKIMEHQFVEKKSSFHIEGQSPRTLRVSVRGRGPSKVESLQPY